MRLVAKTMHFVCKLRGALSWRCMAGAWRVRKNDVVAQQRHYQQGEGDTLEDAIHAVCKQDRLKRSEVVMTCIDLRISKKRSPKDLATVSKLKAVLQIPVLSNGGLTASLERANLRNSSEWSYKTLVLLSTLVLKLAM